MGECEPRNFLRPCLLLLLRERSDHGYDLVNRLRQLHVVDGDAGAVYRALRGLERDDLVRSTWETSDAGPARRTYQLTHSGVADLDRQAVLLEATHHTLHVFRGRYERLMPGGVDRHPERQEENGDVHGGGRHGHGQPGDGGVHPTIRAGERAGG
jgi:poly-beta-hydroxybutyrate-responsive repressor